MKQKRIAVLFGGSSSEHSVSLASAAGVLAHMDRARYVPVMVGITERGDWYHYTGSLERIAAGTWQDGPDCAPALLSPSARDRGLLVFRERKVERMALDGVFPVLHGKNGEDGSVQGLCQLAGLPVVGCGVLASALCMDKDRAHRLVQAAGLQVPASFSLEPGFCQEEALERGADMGYPLFVKPVRAGSSYGVSKVYRPEHLLPAISAALRYDNRVLVEAAMDGTEVGCAVMGTQTLRIGKVDQIALDSGFFDYTEKYNLITAKIHVPAPIPAQTAARLKETAKEIYRILGCSGFARVDMFLTSAQEIFFHEVNTIPGFTPHSRFPKMMEAAGMSLQEVITHAIEEAVAL